MSILQNENIKLRPIMCDDLFYLNKWKNDESIYRYLGGGFLPTSIDVQKNWLNNLMDTSGNNKRFIIEYQLVPVGMIGLYSINWIHRTCELGLFIGEINYQGKGIAKKSYYLLEKYVKEYLNLRKIKLLVVKDNAAAIHLYNNVGFETVGILKQDRFIEGKYCDVCIMEKILDKGECYETI